MATEVALLPLKTGSDVHDANSSAGTIVQECLTTVLGQPGCERVFWGTEEENASMMRWFVQWNSVKDHKKFMAAREYGPFLKNLGSVMDGSPTIYHVSLPNHPASHIFSNTSSPATELLTLFFESSIDTAKTESSLKQFVSVLEKVNKDNAAYHGSTAGWAEELVNGQKAYFLAFGWESVQAHQDARAKAKTNKEMQDAMPLLKELPGHKDTQMVHAKLTQQDGKGASGFGGMGGEERGALATNAQEEVLNPHDKSSGGVKTKADGTTTKTQDGIPQHKERAGRGGETGYHHSGGPKGN